MFLTDAIIIGYIKSILLIIITFREHLPTQNQLDIAPILREKHKNHLNIFVSRIIFLFNKINNMISCEGKPLLYPSRNKTTVTFRSIHETLIIEAGLESFTVYRTNVVDKTKLIKLLNLQIDSLDYENIDHFCFSICEKIFKVKEAREKFEA